MLTNLRRITSTEEYKDSGGMRVKEILIKPWESADAKFIFEIWDDYDEDKSPETWEVLCTRLARTDGIPLMLIPRTQLKLFSNHPLLWVLDDEVFFSITSKSDQISELMGDLFIEHTRLCGNWIDFHWLYSSLPKTLETLRENQLAIPVQLKNACFQILEKYGVGYKVNEVEKSEKGYKVLFFSNTEIWPDEENFRQSYIIAKEFSERRID